jgi:hypothetical protein
VAHRVLLVTAAMLALAGILTGCTATVTTEDGTPASSGAALAAATDSPAPAAPSAAPPAAANPWTPATCTWATANLSNDSQLDRAAAARGTDPRWPAGTPAYYEQSAVQWDQTRWLVMVQCGQAPGGEPAACTDAMAWLDQGALNHEADLQRAGIIASDASWDRAWTAFYRTLSADIATGCGHD